MKTFSITILLAALAVFTSCGNNKNEPGEKTSLNGDSTSIKTTADQVTQKPGTINEIVSGYLDVKNALAGDNGKEAGNAANEIKNSLEKLDTTALTPEQMKTWVDVEDDIKEHAEHIAANSSNIEHQREHFEMLSQDMIDLVKAAGSNKTLYKDFCPMFNDNKGASWLSEVKEIKNPYLGKKMPNCGEVKEEIRARE